MRLIMSKYSSQSYALMRMVAGFLFLWHGAQKLFGVPVAIPVDVPAFITYIAGPIELIGGALVMVGLFTHWSAFFASGLMAAAYWMGHGTKMLLPIQNDGELAALYCFVFLFISTQGSGIWSVDAWRTGAGRREKNELMICLVKRNKLRVKADAPSMLSRYSESVFEFILSGIFLGPPLAYRELFSITAGFRLSQGTAAWQRPQPVSMAPYITLPTDAAPRTRKPGISICRGFPAQTGEFRR